MMNKKRFYAAKYANLSLLSLCKKVNDFDELFHRKIREKFFHEIHLAHVPAFAVEIGQFPGIGGEIEAQRPAPQALVLFAVLAVGVILVTPDYPSTSRCA